MTFRITLPKPVAAAAAAAATAATAKKQRKSAHTHKEMMRLLDETHTRRMAAEAATENEQERVSRTPTQ
jgi:hypothetical protein